MTQQKAFKVLNRTKLPADLIWYQQDYIYEEILFGNIFFFFKKRL